MIYGSTSYFFDRTKLDKLPKMKREYELYKHNFIKNGGWNDGYELMTYEEFEDANEREEQ